MLGLHSGIVGNQMPDVMVIQKSPEKTKELATNLTVTRRRHVHGHDPSADQFRRLIVVRQQPILLSRQWFLSDRCHRLISCSSCYHFAAPSYLPNTSAS